MEHEIRPFSVCVKTDETGCIIDINSDEFLPSMDDWQKIDEGYGDKFHHAQGNYLPKPITDDRGVYRYKLADGAVVERTTEEMDADWEEPTPEQDQGSQVDDLRESVRQLQEALDLLLSGEVE